VLLEKLFVVLSECSGAMNVAQIMLNFLHFGSLQLNADERLGRLLQILHLHRFALLVYNQLHQLHDSPGVKLLLIWLFLFAQPLFELQLNPFPNISGDKLQHLVFRDVFDCFDGVDEFQDEGSAPFEHSDIDVFSAARMEAGFDLVFRFARV